MLIQSAIILMIVIVPNLFWGRASFRIQVHRELQTIGYLAMVQFLEVLEIVEASKPFLLRHVLLEQPLNLHNPTAQQFKFGPILAKIESQPNLQPDCRRPNFNRFGQDFRWWGWAPWGSRRATIRSIVLTAGGPGRETIRMRIFWCCVLGFPIAKG